MSEYVEVLDITFISVNKDVLATFTIREHEGDVIKVIPGGMQIVMAAKDVTLPNGETKRVTSEQHTIAAANTFQITRKYRYEKRVRPSLADFMNNDKLQLEMNKLRKELE